jgi:hypothetical protein
MSDALVPSGTIVMRHTGSCGTGWTDATAEGFARNTIRGYDDAGTDDSIPDLADLGSSSDGECSDDEQDTGCDATAVENYDDLITGLETTGAVVANGTGLGTAGASVRHFHPFKTVIFCRKL